jgi:hypothetical protein
MINVVPMFGVEVTKAVNQPLMWRCGDFNGTVTYTLEWNEDYVSSKVYLLDVKPPSSKYSRVSVYRRRPSAAVAPSARVSITVAGGGEGGCVTEQGPHPVCGQERVR